MNQIRIENGIIMFYGNRAGRVEDGCAVADPMFKGDELCRFLEGHQQIREVKWMDGMFDRLMAGGRRAPRHRRLKMSASGSLSPMWTCI